MSVMGFDLAGYLAEHTRVHAVYGSEHVVPCVCDTEDDDKAHLWVNTKKGKAICYRCGLRHGDVASIVAQISGLDSTSAVRLVRERSAGAAAWHGMRTALSEAQAALSEGNRDAQLERIELPSQYTPVGSTLPPYAQARGLDLATCHAYRIGTCSEGYFADRLIVPVYDAAGTTLKSFVGRLMVADPGRPKVIYPRGSRTSRLLFNQAAAARYDTVVVTEGVFDAMRVGQYAVCLFGKHASPAQKQLLAELGETRRIAIMLDADAWSDALQLAKDLMRLGVDATLAPLPDGRKDPGECTKAEVEWSLVNAKKLDRAGKLQAALGVRREQVAPLPSVSQP